MEPNAAPNSHAAPRLLFSLLALAVGLFIATVATPVYAQQALDPNRCVEDAEVYDDRDDMNGSDEDSVAVGCGAAVQQAENKSATNTVKQPLFTLDSDNDGDVDDYLVMVSCDNSDAGVCNGRTGNQYVEIDKALYDRLQTVGDDMMEMAGVRTAGPLTEAEMGMLTAALMNAENVRDVADMAAGLTDTGTDIMRAASTSNNEVTGGVAVGSGATVMANGGVAIGDGANVGNGKSTTVNPTMVMGVLVGYSESSSGGGGDNGIAIGNGASATGMNSIAIGNGAKATGNGQVVIGGHDIGAMASDMADNRTMINQNTDRIGHQAGRINKNREMIGENTEMIKENSGKIDNNAKRIDGHDAMLNDHGSRLMQHGTKIDENRGMIGANTQMLGAHKNMIDNAMSRLDNHATVLMSHNERLMAHGATLAAHASRLDAHDQVLAGHAAGINNNAMKIDMLDERVSQVAAASAALSAVPNAPDMDEQFFVGVGVGGHGGESSVAAGISGRLGANKNIVVNAGVANSGSGTSVRAGVGWSF